jgi:hypothetical protein
MIAAAEPTRHRTTQRGAPGRRTFVKSPRSPDHRAYLLQEATVYRLVRDQCPATAGRLPDGVRWNADADELEMAAVPAEDLASRVSAAGVLEPVVAAAVGRAVGEFHGEAGDPGDEAPASLWLTGGIGVDRPGLDHFRRSSAGGLKLLEALQRSHALPRLAGLAPPVRDGMVHGDLRWENLLVARDLAPRVWLVDWEMGGAGEHAWDAACVAAAAVSAWLSSMPQIPGVPPDRLMAEADIPMGALGPGLEAFWSAYRAALPGARGDAWAERCAQLAAVRLIHLGFEWADLDMGVRPSAVAHLQVASNILGDPLRAGSDLLRIP